jgi:hypothetical protein
MDKSFREENGEEKKRRTRSVDAVSIEVSAMLQH